jgi:hypothetical protein
MPSSLSIRIVLLSVLALVTSFVRADEAPIRRTPGADAFRAAIDLAPESALGVFVVPNLKLASDDMAECLARIEGDASAVPLRPLDLVRAQTGVGAGIDESGSLVLWSQMTEGRAEFCVLVPVTDGKAAMESSLKPAADGQPGFDHPQYGRLHARDLGRHILVSRSRQLVDAYGQKPGLAKRITDRVGIRGTEVLFSGDAAAWGGSDAMRQMREQGESMQRGQARGGQTAGGDLPSAASSEAVARADLDGNGEIDGGDRAMLLLEMGERGENRADLNRDGVVDDKDQAQLDVVMGRKVNAQVAQGTPPEADPAAAAPRTASNDGVQDGVVAIDLDPLGVSVRTFAMMAPESPLGQATRGGARGQPARLTRLPKGPFVVAFAADMRGLGGGGAFIDLASQVPGAPAIPEWIRENRELLEGMQFAIYPSKLGMAGGGMLNEAMAWLATQDPAKARTLMRDWLKGLAGIDGAMERKVAWEEGRVLKDGTAVDAYAVTEAAAPKDAAAPAGGARRRGIDPMQRMARTMVFGPRGPHGFAKEMPGGLLVTFSQRPDVLQRGMRAAEGKETLEAEPVIEALRAWIAPDADIVGYVGVGSLLSVVRQAANSFPGMSLQLPDAPPSLEPIAFSVEVQDGHVETATMVPTGVIGVITEAYKASRVPEEEEGLNAEPVDPDPAPAQPKGQKPDAPRGKPSPDEDP